MRTWRFLLALVILTSANRSLAGPSKFSLHRLEANGYTADESAVYKLKVADGKTATQWVVLTRRLPKNDQQEFEVVLDVEYDGPPLPGWQAHSELVLEPGSSPTSCRFLRRLVVTTPPVNSVLIRLTWIGKTYWTWRTSGPRSAQPKSLSAPAWAFFTQATPELDYKEPVFQDWLGRNLLWGNPFHPGQSPNSGEADFAAQVGMWFRWHLGTFIKPLNAPSTELLRASTICQRTASGLSLLEAAVLYTAILRANQVPATYSTCQTLGGGDALTAKATAWHRLRCRFFERSTDDWWPVNQIGRAHV